MKQMKAIRNRALMGEPGVTDRVEAASDPQTDCEDLLETYRSTARDTAPPHLDAIVLKSAAVEAEKVKSFEWFLPWRRPAAFVMAVGLCLAILIEFDEVGFIDHNPALQFIDKTQITTDPVEPGILQKFSSAATDSSMRMREIGQTANHQSLGSDPNFADSADQESHSCSDEKTQTPESWLECIEELRANGSQDMADTELERLLLAYPEMTLLLTR